METEREGLASYGLSDLRVSALGSKSAKQVLAPGII